MAKRTSRHDAREKLRALAQQRYLEKHEEIRQQLERLENLLFEHASPDDDEHPITFAHVGDLEYAHARLAEVIQFLSKVEN